MVAQIFFSSSSSQTHQTSQTVWDQCGCSIVSPSGGPPWEHFEQGYSSALPQCTWRVNPSHLDACCFLSEAYTAALQSIDCNLPRQEFCLWHQHSLMLQGHLSALNESGTPCVVMRKQCFEARSVHLCKMKFIGSKAKGKLSDIREGWTGMGCNSSEQVSRGCQEGSMSQFEKPEVGYGHAPGSVQMATAQRSFPGASKVRDHKGPRYSSAQLPWSPWGTEACSFRTAMGPASSC